MNQETARYYVPAPSTWPITGSIALLLWDLVPLSVSIKFQRATGYSQLAFLFSFT